MRNFGSHLLGPIFASGRYASRAMAGYFASLLEQLPSMVAFEPELGLGPQLLVANYIGRLNLHDWIGVIHHGVSRVGEGCRQVVNRW